MGFPLGVLLGIVIEFIFARIAERTNKKAGDECLGYCEFCHAHCVGYHCYLVRQREADRLNAELEENFVQFSDDGEEVEKT